jgi:hypothetical protein
MPATVKVDGCQWRIEKVAGPESAIRVQHGGGQHSPMHGPGTSGEHEFLVYPCQRHQYEFLNSQLPPAERANIAPEQQPAGERPWWSFGAGERASLRE